MSKEETVPLTNRILLMPTEAKAARLAMRKAQRAHNRRVLSAIKGGDSGKLVEMIQREGNER